ncbi:MAG: M20/M25/M40 family metallo-hydrolase [Actinomycetota bacterium]|nr:M20/M25/M40 family metallo-hydrolase [Actinomycetota bacterium]
MASSTGSRAAAALGALLVVVAGVLTLLSERPPSPVSASAPAQQFSAQRALVALREFATEPRPLGSVASDHARDYLVDVLHSAGFSVQIQRAVGASSTEGVAALGRVDNIVATLPGRDPTGSVVLAAHYDSVAAGPGASDDGAAIAAMLETVRALRDGDQLRNDLVLLITDGEENGLLGAAAFADHHPLTRQRVVVLNWEARGVSGPSLMFETSRDNAALVDVFAGAAPHPHGDSSLIEFYRLLPNNTDFTEFAGAGLPGMNFAYIEGAARYHTPGDSIANLDPASLQHHGANMLGLTRALGNSDLATLTADHDVIFFRVLGLVIIYSTALVWPLALLVVIVLAGLVTLARRRRLLSIPRLLLSAVSVVLPLAAAAVATQGLWWVLVQLRPDYADNPFLYHPQLYQLAAAGLAALAVLAWYLLLRRRLDPAALACGPLVWLALLSVSSAWVAPATSHLVALPALFLTGGGLVALLLPRRSVWPVLAITAGIIPSVVLLMPLGVATFDAAGLAGGGAAATLLALFGLTLLPLVEGLLPPVEQPLGKRRAVLVAVAGMVVVLTLTGAGLAVDKVDAAHPHTANLNYVLDSDTGRARWVSQDTEPAEWTRRYVTERSESAVVGFEDGPVWTGPAATVPVPTPEVTLRSRQSNTVELHVSSPRSAPTVVLRVDHRIDEVTVTAPGLAAAAVTLLGTGHGRWPTEVRFNDLPPEGIDLTLATTHQGPLRISVYDQTHGLADVPGFRPRPPTLEPRHSDSDAVVVARTYQF